MCVSQLDLSDWEAEVLNYENYIRELQAQQQVITEQIQQVRGQADT